MMLVYGFAVIYIIQQSTHFMMTSKAEYLKRYMSEESVVKKKKKEKKPVGDRSR